MRGGYRRVPEGLQGLPEEDAEAEEEGAEQTLPGERGHSAGEGLATQQGFIQAAVGGRWGPGLVARVCLQGGDWNSLKQLFNYQSGCQESPVQTHAHPLKGSLSLQPLPALATPVF